MDQIPPLHSAKRLQGKRAYQYARTNSEIELDPQTVEIYDFQITDIELPFVSFYIQVSKAFICEAWQGTLASNLVSLRTFTV